MLLPHTLLGMSTQLLLFCVSLGVFGCLCPLSFSRRAFELQSSRSVGACESCNQLPPLWGGVLSGGQLGFCLLLQDPGVVWSDW